MMIGLLGVLKMTDSHTLLNAYLYRKLISKYRTNTSAHRTNRWESNPRPSLHSGALINQPNFSQ